jgi:PAS domain S-box-containing protein
LALRKRAIIPPILLLAILAGLTGFLALNHLASTQRLRTLVLQSHAVIEQAQGLLSEVQDAETGQRGFMITRDPFYLDPYTSAREAVPDSIRRLRLMVADSTAETRRVDELAQLVDGKLDELARTIALDRAGKTNEARAVVFTDHGNVAMEKIRRSVHGLIEEEGRQLAVRTAPMQRADDTGFVVALLASVAAIFGLGFAIVALAVSNRRLEREIGERRHAQAGQKESQALYGAVFTNSPDYLFVLDVRDGRFTVADANPALAAVLGPEVRGADIGAFAERNPGSGGLAHCLAVLETGRPSIGRGTVTTHEGERIWETTLAPLRDGKGLVYRLVGASRDITERERAEAERQRFQRMEAIGQLTGGVAHDFNNLLQVIRANLELMLPLLKDDATARRRAEGALHGADRAAQLTRQLLAFARRQPLAPAPINAGRLVEDMAELLRRTLGESIEIETRVEQGVWNTMADPAQVESAVLNLVINARDAMPDGGRLTISIGNAMLDEAYARDAEDVTPGPYVEIAVSDTGTGMDPETAARVFEPFFTTKGEEKGTGLGLSMVYGFVKQSRGHVQIDTRLGHGATVRLFLPRSDLAETAPVRGPRPAGQGPLGKGRVVLVVEDEPLVRASALDMLQAMGFRTLAAGTAAEARSQLKADRRIDILFTDVGLPDLKGPALALEALEQRPELKVVFASGYNSERTAPGMETGVYLAKPYGREALERAMEDQPA